jgi:hypothetical protein
MGTVPFVATFAGTEAPANARRMSEAAANMFRKVSVLEDIWKVLSEPQKSFVVFLFITLLWLRP